MSFIPGVRRLQLKVGPAIHGLVWPWAAADPLCDSVASVLNEGSNSTHPVVLL